MSKRISPPNPRPQPKPAPPQSEPSNNFCQLCMDLEAYPLTWGGPYTSEGAIIMGLDGLEGPAWHHATYRKFPYKDVYTPCKSKQVEIAAEIINKKDVEIHADALANRTGNLFQLAQYVGRHYSALHVFPWGPLRKKFIEEVREIQEDIRGWKLVQNQEAFRSYLKNGRTDEILKTFAQEELERLKSPSPEGPEIVICEGCHKSFEAEGLNAYCLECRVRPVVMGFCLPHTGRHTERSSCRNWTADAEGRPSRPETRERMMQAYLDYCVETGTTDPVILRKSGWCFTVEPLKKAEVKRMPVQMGKDQVEFQLKCVAGRILTLVDAMVSNEAQNKAFKTYVKKEFREQFNRLFQFFHEEGGCTDTAPEELEIANREL